MTKREKTAAVLVPVYKPDKKFRQLIKRLNAQTRMPDRIVLMITVQEGETEKEAKAKVLRLVGGNEIPIEYHFVPKSAFDHGGTRNAGMAFCDTDYVICMTEDAVPAGSGMVEALLAPFEEEIYGAEGGRYEGREILISYGRQLPNASCREAEKFTRAFNYPEEGRIKTSDDLDELGIKTFFASNVCSAYRRDLFLERGGFPERTIFNEDMIFAGRAIRAGYAIAYAADAHVVHSHNLTCIAQFHRNFDLAVSQAEAPDVFAGVRSEGEGIRLVKQTMRHLLKIKKGYLIPGVIISGGCKYMGYLLGKHYKMLPQKMVLFCSLNKHYWSVGKEGKNEETIS